MRIIANVERQFYAFAAGLLLGCVFGFYLAIEVVFREVLN